MINGKKLMMTPFHLIVQTLFLLLWHARRATSGGAELARFLTLCDEAGNQPVLSIDPSGSNEEISTILANASSKIIVTPKITPQFIRPLDTVNLPCILANWDCTLQFGSGTIRTHRSSQMRIIFPENFSTPQFSPDLSSVMELGI